MWEFKFYRIKFVHNSSLIKTRSNATDDGEADDEILIQTEFLWVSLIIFLIKSLQKYIKFIFFPQKKDDTKMF